MQTRVNLVELVRSFPANLLFEPDPYSKRYLLAKLGFATAENESLEFGWNLEIWTGNKCFPNSQEDEFEQRGRRRNNKTAAAQRSISLHLFESNLETTRKASEKRQPFVVGYKTAPH